MKKRIIIGLGIIVALLVVVVIGVALFVDVNQYRGLVQTQLEQQLQRKVTLGRMSLGLIPLRFQVADTVISDDPQFGGQQPFLRAGSLDVRVGLLSLISGNVSVSALDLQRPSVELIKDKQGTWNFSTIGAAKKDSGQAAESGSGTAVSLDKLSIRDGQIAITDHAQGQPRTVYDHIDLTLANYRPGAPFDFDFAVHTPGEGAQELRLNGTAGPVAEDDPAKTPMKATLTLKEVGIEGLRAFLGEAASSAAAGSLSGETQIANQSGNLSAAGKLRVDRARFNNLDVGYPIGLDYDVSAKLPEGLFTITRGAIQLGSTPLSIAGTINTNRTPARIDLNLKSGSVSIAEIARLASAVGVAFGAGTNVAGNISVDLRATGSAEKPALNGTIAGRDLNISGKDVPQPVQVKALDIILTPDEIRSNEFAAVSGKTTVNSRFSVRQYTSASPAIDLGLRAPNATLPEIQSIAKAYGATGIDQINGQGSLNLDLRAQGTTDSLSSPDMMRALNGTLNLDFSPIQLKGFNIAQELASIGGFSSGSENKTISDLLKLTGRVVIKNGIAQSDDLQAQLAIGNLAAAGTADLAAETLNLKVSAVISKAVSDKVGSTRVGGYMRTVLSNPDGELVIPATLTGTFKQPKFSPDVQAFAQMQKQRLLPSLANPKGALSGILGTLTSQQPKPETAAETTEQPAAAAPSPKPAAAIKGLLGGLLGGKKSSGSSLAGTSWRWANSAQFVLTFNNDGSVASSTDCNTFSGTFTADGSKLGIGRLASTRKACQGSQEGPYAASLQDAASYTISGDTLSIGLKSGGSMSFRKNN